MSMEILDVAALIARTPHAGTLTSYVFFAKIGFCLKQLIAKYIEPDKPKWWLLYLEILNDEITQRKSHSINLHPFKIIDFA